MRITWFIWGIKKVLLALLLPFDRPWRVAVLIALLSPGFKLGKTGKWSTTAVDSVAVSVALQTGRS